MTRARLPRASLVLPHRQRGIVVFVALIAIVMLSLAAVGLMRNVNTSTLVVGNLAFRQAAQAMASAAVEKAIYDMFDGPGPPIADHRFHNTVLNYYASLQPNQDAMGVPFALQGDSTMPNYPGGAQKMTDRPVGQGEFTAYYIIERMCDDDAIGFNAIAMQADCEMIPPKQSTAKETNIPRGIVLPRIPFYRMTVRVNGPGNSVAYSQAMLR
ncbi:MAG TPA: hypothetical protein VNE58_10555 [Casimicrobiaceae bacterium]|nr:hypothetical protein [Casimicrobiaceae bacterium]